MEVLFGLVVWHINPCWLFNAKSFLYVGYDLVGFYGISTIVGYLMLNPLYTDILNIYDLVYFGLLWFNGISTLEGYVMTNRL